MENGCLNRICIENTPFNQDLILFKASEIRSNFPNEAKTPPERYPKSSSSKPIDIGLYNFAEK